MRFGSCRSCSPRSSSRNTSLPGSSRARGLQPALPAASAFGFRISAFGFRLCPAPCPAASFLPLTSCVAMVYSRPNETTPLCPLRPAQPGPPGLRQFTIARQGPVQKQRPGWRGNPNISDLAIRKRRDAPHSKRFAKHGHAAGIAKRLERLEHSTPRRLLLGIETLWPARDAVACGVRGSAAKTVRTLVHYARFGAWSWRFSGHSFGGSRAPSGARLDPVIEYSLFSAASRRCQVVQ